MRCERYWREGVLLVERGRPDPHRESCLDCRREHEARGELVRAFALVGAHAGDPRWQARVWQQIDRAEVPGRRSIAWFGAWSGALAAAAALVAFMWVKDRGGDRPHDQEGVAVASGDDPRFEIVPSEIARRSTSAGLGDRVRIRVRADQEARIYRAERLILRCTAATTATEGCTRDRGGVLAEHTLTLTGDYQLLIVPAGIADPAVPEGVLASAAPAERPPSLDADLAAILRGGATYQRRDLEVR